MAKSLNQNKVNNTMDATEDIIAVYGCDEHPLSYMIEPKGSVEIVGSKEKKPTEDIIPKEDLENIL